MISGAKVKRRNVIKTEIWPHIICNENEGVEVNSENIGLAKFFTFFTHIMVNCTDKVEAKGRSVLLHSISLILDCLPWSEARIFHNLTMVKIEQGQCHWSSDFATMAEKYLDSKLRQSLRNKTSSSASSSGGRQAYYNKNYSNKFGSSYRNSNYGTSNYKNNKNKSLYAFVCRQWNFGTCSYGDRCRKWHTCWSCAEAGKLGETHKASSDEHSNARSTRQGQAEQRS